MAESKRVKNLRSEIIKAIPKFPNNRETKEKLESMPLATLLIHYLSWMSRYISIKPRKIATERTVTADARWKTLKAPIEAFLEKVGAGENLTPHLSIQPHLKGYTPEAANTGPDVDRWADKDFLLNVMGFHHFHLGTELESTGHIKRTADVLFARVTREEFTAIGIFNHSVFESTEDEMSAERQRLWQIFDDHTSRGVPPGSILLASPTATSGHPIHLVSTAQKYSRVIREVDPKLDDKEYVKELYKSAGTAVPEKPKLEWSLDFSDLGIHERRSQRHLIVFGCGFN